MRRSRRCARTNSIAPAIRHHDWHMGHQAHFHADRRHFAHSNRCASGPLNIRNDRKTIVRRLDEWQPGR